MISSLEDQLGPWVGGLWVYFWGLIIFAQPQAEFPLPIYMCIYTCVHACMYVCIYMHICIWKEKTFPVEAEKKTVEISFLPLNFYFYY